MASTRGSKVSVIGAISVAVLIAAYIIKSRNNFLLQKRVDATLDSLLALEKGVTVNAKNDIAIGYGSCMDVSIESRNLIMKNFEPPSKAEHHVAISNVEEFLEMFAFYFQAGAATEQYIGNLTLFDELLELTLREKSVIKVVGGNAALMALRFSKEGMGNVILGAQMSKNLRSYFPKELVVPVPNIATDNRHLIIEYPAGEIWGDKYVSPRANRFIIHSDSNNIVQSMGTFHDAVKKVKPEIFIIGGLQQMSNLPSGFGPVKKSLHITENFISELYSETNAKVHLEMASYSDDELFRNVVNILVPKVDSLGMNEQELSSLDNMLLFGNVSVVSESYPRVATVLDEMRDVYNVITDERNGRVNRIHVHTLAFQAILTKKVSGWKNTLASMVKAALTAHRHTCGSHEIDNAKAKLIMDDSFTTTRSNGRTKVRIPFDEKNPVPCWEEKTKNGDLIEICVAPVLVCTKVLQTCGGGDNVSAAGLVLQI